MARKNKTENDKEAVQVDLFGNEVSSVDIIERHQINLTDENPKETTLEMTIEGATIKHDKNLILLFGKSNNKDCMLGLFTKHSEQFPSTSMPNGKRLGKAVSYQAKWTVADKTYDDVIEWLNENDCVLSIKHDDKGRLFTITN